MIDPWFPKGLEPIKGSKIKTLLFLGDRWQIYKTEDNKNVLIARKLLANIWIDSGLLESTMLNKFNFAGDEFYAIASQDKYILAPTDYKYFEVDKISALSFASSLRETRRIAPSASLEDSVYLEQFSRILPVSELISEKDDGLFLGTWLSGGVPVPTTSIRRLKNLTINFSLPDLEEIIETAGISDVKIDIKDSESKSVIIKKRSDKFQLPGAAYLEHFFFENIIDIVQHPERYGPMGIEFPSPIILYGEPGTGKTYSVEKLAEFLDWPVYSIDSNSVGSPYIHQTGQKIAAVFNKAFETSPAIVIIDEMEAYLPKRDGAQDFRVEEVGEFLRLIPEAVKNNVLVVGMTNLLQNIDPAILRTGRFDHKIEVKMPSKEDIKTMVDVALSKLPIESNLNSDTLINALVGRPRSDVSFIIKEAARLTAFRGKSKVSQEELDEALNTKLSKTKTEKQTIGFDIK